MAFNTDRQAEVRDEGESVLIEQFRSGDERSLDVLLTRHWAPLVSFAYGYLQNVDAAEDVVQEAFVRLWEKRHTWQPGGSIRSYLYTSVRNLSLHERDRRRVRKLWALRQSPQPSTATTALDHLQADETLRLLEEAIAALPARRREIFRLTVLEGFSHREAAEILGLSVQTVSNQLSAAIRALRGVTDRDAP